MTTTPQNSTNPPVPQNQAGAGDLADQLSELARDLQDDTDFEATLTTMVHATLQLVPGAAAASISVVEARRTIRPHALLRSAPRCGPAAAGARGRPVPGRDL